MLTTRKKPSTSEDGSKAGAIPRPSVARVMPPVGREARIETANDVVQATFVFILSASVLVHTVDVGVSRIRLESPDPYLLREQIQGVCGERSPVKHTEAVCITIGSEVLCPVSFVFSIEREHALVRQDFLIQDIGDKSLVRGWIGE